MGTGLGITQRKPLHSIHTMKHYAHPALRFPTIRMKSTGWPLLKEVAAYCSHGFGKRTHERRRDIWVEAEDDGQALDAKEDQQEFLISNSHIIQLSQERLQFLHSIHNYRRHELN